MGSRKREDFPRTLYKFLENMTYNVQHYLMAYAKHGTFPSKTEVKRIVKTSIHSATVTLEPVFTRSYYVPEIL